MSAISAYAAERCHKSFPQGRQGHLISCWDLRPHTNGHFPRPRGNCIQTCRRKWQAHIDHDAVRVGDERLQEDPEDVIQEAQRQQNAGHLQCRHMYMYALQVPRLHVEIRTLLAFHRGILQGHVVSRGAPVSRHFCIMRFLLLEWTVTSTFPCYFSLS